jgi:hypothetical protein
MVSPDSASAHAIYRGCRTQAELLLDSVDYRLSADETWPATHFERQTAKAVLSQIDSMTARIYGLEKVSFRESGPGTRLRFFLQIGTTREQRLDLIGNGAFVINVSNDLHSGLEEGIEKVRRPPSFAHPMPSDHSLRMLLVNFERRLQALREHYTELQPQLLLNPAIAQSFAKQMTSLHTEFRATELCWLERIQVNHRDLPIPELPRQKAIPRLLRSFDYRGHTVDSYESTKNMLTEMVNTVLKPLVHVQYRGRRQ